MNVITAMGDEKLNDLLKKEKDIQVIGFDIQYQEGIFEVLELNNNIEFLIINLNIIGELKCEELIEKIKSINKDINFIIYVDRETENINSFLLNNNIKYIFNKNNYNPEKIINIIKNKNIINNNQKNKIIINEKINNKNYKLFLLNKIIKKIINFKKKIIKYLINSKKNTEKIFNNNYKINIMLNIKIYRKNKIKLNKKININKCIDNLSKREEFIEEILKIVKEEL